jgi:hypothetical protein
MDHLSFKFRASPSPQPRAVYSRGFKIAFWTIIWSGISALVGTTAWVLLSS